MPLSGAAIEPDAILAFTGERELTRFARDGSRAAFALPFAPLVWQIGPAGVWLVDDRGTVHRYTTAGEAAGATALGEAPGPLRGAALSADGRWLALLADEIQVFERGAWRPWTFAHRRGTWRELGVDLSADGRYILARVATANDPRVLGAAGERLVIGDAEGAVIYRRLAAPPLVHVLAPDARHLATCEDGELRIDATGSMHTLHRLALPHVRRFGFAGGLLGALTDAQLVLVEVAGGRVARLDLPEEFTDLVLGERDAVVLHPELGAWWIPLASVTFTPAAG